MKTEDRFARPRPSYAEGKGASALRRRLLEEFQELRAGRKHDPLRNPVLLFALSLARRLSEGALSLHDMETLSGELAAAAYGRRAFAMRRYMSVGDSHADAGGLRALFLSLTLAPDGSRRPFADFRRDVERHVFGIILTAHPTFALDGAQLRSLGRLACGGEASPAAEEAVRTRKRPPLFCEERDLAFEALGHLRAALRRLYETVLGVAFKVYGEEALSLRPGLVTLASWVGYDMDGRNDMSWADSFHTRLSAHALCLEATGRRLRELAADAASGEQELRALLEGAAERLEEDKRITREAVSTFAPFTRDAHAMPDAGEGAAGDTGGGRSGVLPLTLPCSDDAASLLAAASRRLTGARRRFPPTRVSALCRTLDEATALCVKEKRTKTALSIAVLRSELATCGLGFSHIHVRLNASQLHNAIRGLIGMEGSPDDAGRSRFYLRAVNRLLDKVRPASVNFGSLLGEDMSARRMVMAIAQMLKYTDTETPIRLLLAECETPLTVLAALYLARLFGIEERVEISPLFETPRALARGARVMEALLDNPHYRAYVERHGRMWVEAGYSDSGRFIGQAAAALSIEHLHVRLAQALARRGATGIELVMFDTHGESLGRGGHPGGMAERLAYLASPRSRALFRRLGVATREEVSFQGGDGYAWFLHPPLAEACLGRMMACAFGRNGGFEGAEARAATPVPAAAYDSRASYRDTLAEGGGDPFYKSPDYGADAAALIRQFNESLMASPGYGALLGLFGAHMTAPSGSRSADRQWEETESVAENFPRPPRQWRAIPQNAILQQLGFSAHVLGGVGALLRREGALYEKLWRDSARVRSVLSLVARAFSLSDGDVFASYVALRRPETWLAWARALPEKDARHVREVAALLEGEGGVGEEALGLLRLLRCEYDAIADWLAAGGASGAAAGAAPSEEACDFFLLHGMRAALICALYRLIPRIPTFRPQHGYSHESLSLSLLRLDVAPALAALRRIFPVSRPLAQRYDFGEKTDYRETAREGYARAHSEVFDVMERLDVVLRRIGAAMAHLHGAVG